MILGIFHAYSVANDFVDNYDPLPKTQKTKAKICSWHHIKLNIICTTKETINRMKR
jgi:hypothetical protein